MGWEELQLDRVYYDATRGVAGTIWPIGTPRVPSSVIADVITMCTARRLRNIDVHGALQLLATMEHYCFFGHCHESIADLVDLNGQDVDNSRFDNCIITGAQAGAEFATYINCILYNMTGFRGMAENCALYTPLAVSVGISDFDRCNSLHGVLTVTVGAPTRLSFKKFSGGMILTLQTGGVALVRGISGYLEVDEMTGGTLDIHADAADITINADCTGGTINIYGNARVTDNSGATVVNDYSKETQLDAIEAAVAAVALEATLGTHDTDIKALLATIAGYLDTEIADILAAVDTEVAAIIASQAKQLFTMDFWSDPQEEVQVPAAAATLVLTPTVQVAERPAGATIVRVTAMFKFRMVENTYDGANALDGATVAANSQVIQVKETAAGAYVDAINFADNQFTLDNLTREGGDVLIGSIDIAGEVNDNDNYTFQWLLRKCDSDFINFNDVQLGLRIWYSV